MHEDTVLSSWLREDTEGKAKEREEINKRAVGRYVAQANETDSVVNFNISSSLSGSQLQGSVTVVFCILEEGGLWRWLFWEVWE